jgi:chemotaxis signal transduction protein/nucleoid-associated protein YgaU
MRELFLVSCGGIRYGIWKDGILSLRSLDALHRIPLSPARIAGILIDDGRTVTLADLSACLGYPPSPGKEQTIAQGSILLMGQGEKVTGFVVSGEIEPQSIPADLLFPLPEFLKTPVFDCCAVDDGIPVPIINVAALYARAMQAGDQASVDSLQIPDVQAQDVSGTDRIRFFTVAGERFAASAAGIAEPVNPGVVTPLPGMPRYVQGVTFRDGRLLAVIDLPQLIKGQSAVPQSPMLIAEIAGDAYGLLVDGDGGILPAAAVAIKPVPMITRSPWLKQMVVRGGELVPLVDLAMALSCSAAGSTADEKPLWQRYAPGSGFDDRFFRHDVDVLEFSLLGERHALPKEEVEEVIAFQPCRALPDAPSIVTGVVEHNGEILPVLDLAMMFGRRSLATPAWRMMLVNNGDFRALVVTETVFRERRLPSATHRAVPLKLPHHLMYGCYPDAEAVRIILNVEAIAVHFDESLIQKFLPALSPGMKMMSAEAVMARELEPAAATAQPVDHAARAQASARQRAAQLVPELQHQAVAVAIEPAAVREEFSAAATIAPEAGPVDVEFDFVFVSSASPAWVSSTRPVRASSADTQGSPEELLPEEFSEEAMAPEAVMAGQSPGIVSKFPAQQDATASDFSRTPESAVARSSSGAPYPVRQQQRSAGAWWRRLAYGATAALLLAALFYFPKTADRPDAGKTVQQTLPSKQQPVRVQAEPPPPVEKSAAPAVAKIPQVISTPPTSIAPDMPPASKPADSDVYVVKPGDTLWDIAKRYTGDPYNYPRIAGENRIGDYNLIFPEQKLRLKKY